MPEPIVPVSFRLAQSNPGAFVAHFAGSFERCGLALPGGILPDRPSRYPQPILADDCPGERLREINRLH